MKEHPRSQQQPDEPVGTKQINFRLDNDSYPELRRRLNEDGLYWQTFADCCVQAYLNRDQAMMALVERWRSGLTLSRRAHIKIAISKHGKSSILDEIERLKKERGKDI